MSGNVDLRELAIDRTQHGERPQPIRRNWLTRYVLPAALVLGFVALAAWGVWDTLFPPRQVTVVPVISSTSEVRQEGTPLFKAAGWIEPRPTPVRVAALAPGVVESLLVVEDQPVTAGEAVAELVKADARLAYERALADQQLRQAEVSEAKAALTAAETRFRQPVHLEAALGEADAALTKIETLLKNLPFETVRAKSTYEAAQADYEGKVASEGVVAGIEIKNAKSRMESARALVDELQNRAASLDREAAAAKHRRVALATQRELLADEIKARDEAAAKLRGAEARVEQARIAVAEAQLQLDRMTIRAPIDGRVYRLVADPGARIGGSGNTGRFDGSTVVTMYDPQRLQIRVDVRFEDIPKVSLGQTVEIGNPALAAPITGDVLFISSEADIQKNTLQVKVGIPDPPMVFRPEMLVDVTFLAPKQKEETNEPTEELRFYVPKQLVLQGETGSFVWVADRSAGVARRVNVEVGSSGENGLVEITRGLNLTSRLITSGHDDLQDGDRIEMTEASSSDSAPEAQERSQSINRRPTGEDR